jgi:hypothetical protein
MNNMVIALIIIEKSYGQRKKEMMTLSAIVRSKKKGAGLYPLLYSIVLYTSLTINSPVA